MSSTSERMAKLSPEKLALLRNAMGDSERIVEPIAIVGMGCRFAGANSISQYWDLICERRDMTGEIPASRWDLDRFYDPAGETPGKMNIRWGGFLDDIDRFDASFFGISPREAEKMDPQHRLLLQVVWEALEYGGIAPTSLRESATGVFVGIGATDYSRVPVQLDNYFEQITAYSGTGNALSLAANRISYTLDLRGPSLAIDTACSSSLVAAHLAVRSLRAKECDTAIVGGVNAILTPETTLAFSQAHMLSPDGTCRPFDSRANGYVRGEGCGAVVLKRLSDAVRDRDMVLATIRGSAVNQDGLTSGITAPRGTAQVDVIRRALRDARCQPEEISYIEAHGTATPLGDPIELSSLAEVFRESTNSKATKTPSRPCYLGSVKANIGHTETAAGIASLIKTVLMMQHGTIPGQTHFEQLNEYAGIDGTRLRVAAKSTPWNQYATNPIAGISSFGFGGTNSHLVLEGAPVTAPTTVSENRSRSTGTSTGISADRPRHVMTLSAKTSARLAEMAARLNESIADPDNYPLADACFTAATGRATFQHRIAISITNAADLKQSLAAFTRNETPGNLKHGVIKGEGRRKIAFLFPGQGAQSPAMGRQLHDTHRVFREAVNTCDEILADLLPEPIRHVLYRDNVDSGSNGKPHTPLIHQAQYTQAALFTIEYAMSRLWRSFGIEPAVMLGHSIGDYVAACESGVFSLEDGLKLVAHRGRLVQSLPLNGSMAVVFADRDYVADIIAPYENDVALAAHNGPQCVVISGLKEVVSDLLNQFESVGVKTRVLEVSHAMHSPLLDPILDEFERHASEVTFHSPKIPLISSRDGRRLDERVCRPSYWRDHLRHTVSFVDAVQTLATFSLEAAIEIGPGTTLCGLAGRMWNSEPIAWLPSLRQPRDDWDVVNESVAELFVRGVPIDWKSYDAPFQRRRVVLPTYAFDAQSHWYDLSRARTHHVSPLTSSSPDTHPLVGNRVAMAGGQTVFEQTIDARHPPFLADHCLDQTPVLPAAAYMEQALAVARKLSDREHPSENEFQSVSLSNLSIDQPLVLPGENRRAVQLHVGPEQRGERSFEIHSRADTDDAAWTLHASATIHTSTIHASTIQPGSATPSSQADSEAKTEFNQDTILDRMTYHIDGESFYQRIARVGLDYGPAFRIITELNSGADECIAKMQVPESLHNDLHRYVLHPAILDGCLQSIAGVVIDPGNEDATDLILPTHADAVRVLSPTPSGPMWVHTRRTNSSDATDTFTADLVLYDNEGNRIAEIDGARVQRVAKKRSETKRQPEDLLYAIQWKPAPIAIPSQSATRNPRHWLLFADAGGLADELAAQFQQRGDDATLIHSGDKYAYQSSDTEQAVSSAQIREGTLGDYERLLIDTASNPSSSSLASSSVSVVDLRSLTRGIPEPEEIDQANLAGTFCSGLLLLLRSVAKSTKLKIDSTTIVTRGANSVIDDDLVAAGQTALWGMGRTAMTEMPHLACRLIDLDPSRLSHASMDVLLTELDEPTEPDSQSDPTRIREDHVALRGGDRYIARLEPAADRLHLSQTQTRKKLPASDRFSLRLGVSSSFDELHYDPVGAKTLAPHEVEIAVGSTGLNFSDVLKALGLYPGIQDEIVPLGIECAGVVSGIGESVQRFHIGQRVMGVAPYSFASHTTTADYAIVAIPDNVSDDEAATIPIAFLTAHYALCTLARLAAGERVLIHAGAGGVGLAAIQIAQSVGAEIFATAGSDTKRDYLRSLGVEHVMDSRSLDFADEILAITSGAGIDVVLNSLPGEAITKSLSVLAAYGRFLEIGKTDIYQNRRIGLWPFQDNLSYHAIDLDRMLRQRPAEITRLYDEIGPLFERGVYRPLPLTPFAAEEIVDAFRYMSQRKNIGKVVVSLARDDAPGNQLAAPDSTFAKSGTVLITGGLGAIGRRVAQYAIGHGARHLAILSRRRPEPNDELFDNLRATGAHVTVIQGDVCDAASLVAAIEQLPPEYPPVCGVFHAAGVLHDGLMQTMDNEQLRAAMSPKTVGAWNLHRLFADSLDCFVLFSSVAGTIGSPGQGNYAAGNAFLDGLADHRRYLGLPATSIAWGPWDSEVSSKDAVAVTGMADNEEVRRQLGERGMTPLPPDTAIALLDQSIRNSVNPVAVMDVDWNKLLGKMIGGGSSLLRDFHRNTSDVDQRSSASNRDGQLHAKLKATAPAQRMVEIQSIVTLALSEVMGVESGLIEPEQPLATLGLDSLMGMELRAKLEAKLGIEIPMASLFDEPSVMSLAKISSAAFDDLTSASPPITAASNSNSVTRGDSRTSHRSKPGVVAIGGANGDGVPLFCLHPVGGDLRCYDTLARSIKDRMVYGLRARGLQAGSQAHETMDDLVGDYTDSIRSVCPDGPYCLAGWSTGGIFAYEIARRLHLDSLPVASLIMIDSPLPIVFENVDQSDDARFLVDLIEFANYFAGTSMKIEYDNLHRLSDDKAMEHVLALSIEHGVLPAKTTPEYLRRLVNVCKQHVNILQSYQIIPSDLSVDMLRPESTGLLAHATGQTLSEDLGWSRFVDLHLHQVPGHHFTMMTPPHATTLAETITELLAQPRLLPTVR